MMKVIVRNNVRIGRALGVLVALLLSASAWAGERQAYAMAHDDPELKWGACPAFMPASCKLAVVQGNPAKPDADIFFRLASNTTAPNHWHHSAERMVLVSGEMEVTYEGQQPVVLEPGTYAYGPPEKPHVATCRSQQDCVLFIAFTRPVDAFAVEE